MTGPAAVSGLTPQERREALKQELRAYRIEAINGLDEYTDGGLADRALNLVKSWLAAKDAEIERLRIEVEQYKALADVNDLNAWTDHVRKRVAIERTDERRRTAEEIKRRIHVLFADRFGIQPTALARIFSICDEVGGSDEEQ